MLYVRHTGLMRIKFSGESMESHREPVVVVIDGDADSVGHDVQRTENTFEMHGAVHALDSRPGYRGRRWRGPGFGVVGRGDAEAQAEGTPSYYYE